MASKQVPISQGFNVANFHMTCMYSIRRSFKSACMHGNEHVAAACGWDPPWTISSDSWRRCLESMLPCKVGKTGSWWWLILGNSLSGQPAVQAALLQITEWNTPQALQMFMCTMSELSPNPGRSAIIDGRFMTDENCLPCCWLAHCTWVPACRAHSSLGSRSTCPPHGPVVEPAQTRKYPLQSVHFITAQQYKLYQ